MAKMKISIFLTFCVSYTLATSFVSDEPNSFQDAHADRIRRQVPKYKDPNYLHQLTSPSDYKDIVDKFENTPNSCTNALSSVCNSSELPFHSFEYVTETNRFELIKKRIMNTLEKESNKDDLAPLKTERKHFYNCMKLGQENDYAKQQTLGEFEYIVHQIYNHISQFSSWQSLDNLLNRLGFGHAFYEIKVERDPENFVNNIITLQPPSYTDTKRLSGVVKRILHTSNDFTNEEGWNVWKFFEAMKKNKQEIEVFFDLLLQMISPPTADKLVPHRQIKVSLEHWLQRNNSHFSDTAQIKWDSIISKEFESVNVKIDLNDEIILVKNRQYFSNLYNLLNSTSNNIISSWILTKIFTEQLPYIDWENYQSIQRLKREEFCFGETKLYGASFEVFRDIKAEYIDDISFNSNHEILNNIVTVINTDISRSHLLSENRKKYLKSELKSIANDILRQADEKTVTDYYGDYRANHVYFTDILNYRKMIKSNELSTLRNGLRSPRGEVELYSIVDLYKPRNRVLTKLLILNMIYDVTPKSEIVYSTFGTDLAQFLYSLINENKFVDYEYNFKVDQLLLPVYPMFSAPAIECYKPVLKQNNYSPFINQMLTTMFGIHIAYEAMLQNYETSGIYRGDIQISDLKWISSDKFFFISSMKSHCFLGSNLLMETFFISDLYFNIFDCIDISVEDAAQSLACRQQPFEMQNPNIFFV